MSGAKPEATKPAASKKPKGPVAAKPVPTVPQKQKLPVKDKNAALNMPKTGGRSPALATKQKT